MKRAFIIHFLVVSFVSFNTYADHSMRELVVKAKDLHGECFGGLRPLLATHVDYRYQSDRSDLRSAINCTEIRWDYYQLFRREIVDQYLPVRSNECASKLTRFLNHPTPSTISELEPYMEDRRDIKILTIGSLVRATYECMILRNFSGVRKESDAIGKFAADSR